MASLVFLAGPTAKGGEDGDALIEETLRTFKEESIKSEEQLEDFKGDFRKRVASMSDAERVDFIHKLARTTLMEKRYEDGEEGASIFIGLLHWSGTSREDQARAFTRFLEKGDAGKGTVVKGLLDAIAFSPTAPAESLSAFRPALQEADEVMKGRLVEYLFFRNPAGATEWFAKNVEMPDAQRSKVLAELDAVRFTINPPDQYSGDPVQVPLLTPDETARKVEEWLAGDSWILRLLAKSYLTKYPNRQTPALQLAMKEVKPPATLKLLPYDPLNSRKDKPESNKLTPADPVEKTQQ